MDFLKELYSSGKSYAKKKYTRLKKKLKVRKALRRARKEIYTIID